MSLSIPDARVAQDSTQASIIGDTSVAFQKTIVDAITTSISGKSRTMTVSISGKNASDVMASIQELRRRGYKVMQTGTNIQVDW